jgi:hypothetical protein
LAPEQRVEGLATGIATVVIGIVVVTGIASGITGVGNRKVCAAQSSGATGRDSALVGVNFVRPYWAAALTPLASSGSKALAQINSPRLDVRRYPVGDCAQ